MFTLGARSEQAMEALTTKNIELKGGISQQAMWSLSSVPVNYSVINTL